VREHTSETEKLVERFIARTLPKAEWTHLAHLRVGVWHVVSHGAEAALPLLRERISRYNESVGTINSDTSGYHETVTAFYVKAIAATLAGCDTEMPLDALAELVVDRIGAREYPLRFYSKKRLFSVEARRGWVESDLLPVPSVPKVPKVPTG
jgi:hypothetical protein